MNNIPDNIRKIREIEKSFTQKYMATTLGLSVKAYSNIENGVTDLTINRLNEIAEILECDINYIINYQEHKGGYLNNFYNKGNKGTNIMHQGSDLEKLEKLYERLLQSEQSKVNILETLIQHHNK